jgi:hypothetical protein
MNARQRELIIERDGYKCCECQKQYPKDNYFEWEKRQHPMSRLTVDHIWGRATTWNGLPDERWHMVWTLCMTCHLEKDQGIHKGRARRIATLYVTQFEGKETPEYLAAMAAEADEAPVRAENRKKTRRAKYQRDKKKAGGSPLSKMKAKSAALKAKPKPANSKIPAKVAAQNARPVLNTFHVESP